MPVVDLMTPVEYVKSKLEFLFNNSGANGDVYQLMLSTVKNNNPIFIKKIRQYKKIENLKIWL